MIQSIIYKSKSSILGQSTYIPHKRFVIEILLIRIIILAVLFILPPIMNEQFLCIIITLLVAIDFWSIKNLGRKFLNACWYINTQGEQDQWVFQANLKSPIQAYQAIFWYSFVMYGILLIALGILTLTDSKLSLACAILIGIVANYINFYGFSSIIQIRNAGTLQRIKNEMEGQNIGLIQTIKLPLAYRSKLQDIPEQNSFQNNQQS